MFIKLHSGQKQKQNNNIIKLTNSRILYVILIVYLQVQIEIIQMRLLMRSQV